MTLVLPVIVRLVLLLATVALPIRVVVDNSILVTADKLDDCTGNCIILESCGLVCPTVVIE